MPPVNRPADATLDARTFAVVADGAEILARPALLAAFAGVFGPDDDATLVLTTAAVEELVQGLPAAAAAAGLADEDLPDLLVLPLGGLAEAAEALVDVTHAVLSELEPGEALERLPRCGVPDGELLRRLGATRALIAETGRRLPPNLALPAGYVSRVPPEYFDDVARADAEIVHQPDVYAAAAHLARATGATHIVDVGCGAAEKLLPLAPEFRLIGVDFGTNFEHCRIGHPEHTWLRWDIERTPLPHIPGSVLERSVVVCADVIEHLVDPSGLIVGLDVLAAQAQAVLVSTPDRILVRGAEDPGPPANTAHVREWSLDELVTLLAAGGLDPAFAGHTINNDRDRLKRTSLVILDRRRGGPVEPAPDDFTVTAVLPAFNEADIVEFSVRRLVEQGIHVRLVDNWSTDDTVERVEALGLGDMVRVERFPEAGPSESYDWAAILANTERIAAELAEGWVIHQDVDEVRLPPWPGVTLRDALHHVQRCGYNAVDHTVIDFRPTDHHELAPGDDVEALLRHFEFGTRPGHFLQLKAWHAGVGRVDLASSGGHEAAFAGRRVFPYKFLSKHYPVRSQAHGERKVLAERVARWNAEERARGWHHHYDAVGEGHRFVYDADGLHVDDGTFGTEFLTERLTGVGIPRT